MIIVSPVTLAAYGIRLEPLTTAHERPLIAAASDGRLWELFYAGVAEPAKVGQYITDALAGQAARQMLPWVVRELGSNEIVGTTRYHDIVGGIDRVEIGYTWYAARWQRTHVNTTCKLLLLTHAFERLGCRVVGLRTDVYNVRSQRAIEALGAKKDGVLRHHQRRPDGTVRDTVIYSILAAEWPDVKRYLALRLARGGPETEPDSSDASSESEVYLSSVGATVSA